MKLKFDFDIKKIILVLAILMIFFTFMPFGKSKCNCMRFREGFTDSVEIGEYDYLAPVPPDNKWSTNTLNNFVTAFKKSKGCKMVGAQCNSLTNDPTNILLSEFINTVTEKEAEYFIKNGKFPINKYVKNLLQNTLSEITKANPGLNQMSYEDMEYIWTSRIIYGIYLQPTEKDKNPQPLSYQIYMGTAKPPVSPKPTSQNNNLQYNSSSGLSSADFDEVVSFCKKIVK
jgi:hypothetical protein